jgi:UDP-N-acetylmuramyl pentapeptide phosphotransferase/UDP-N-acetylglucosamine-1-phosphate transferase
MAFLLGYVGWTVTLAVILVAIVSFMDDIQPLSQLPRFGSHIIAFLLIAYDLHLFQEVFWVLPLVMILLIGWINAFNFMDGINGITVLYALVAIGSFSVLPIHEASLPLLITMGLSCLVFGFFNVRKRAKTFAGDVGSISMAVFLGYFLFKTIIETKQVGYVLFFSLYGIDAIITIFYRIKKRENILEPHRSHLYQYLANEWGYSHVVIAIVYAVFQLLVNGIVVWLDQEGELSISNSLLILFVLTFVYLAIRVLVVRKMPLKNT